MFPTAALIMLAVSSITAGAPLAPHAHSSSVELAHPQGARLALAPRAGAAPVPKTPTKANGGAGSPDHQVALDIEKLMKDERSRESAGGANKKTNGAPSRSGAKPAPPQSGSRVTSPVTKPGAAGTKQDSTHPNTRPNSGSTAAKPHTSTKPNGRKPGLAPPTHATGGQKPLTGSKQAGSGAQRQGTTQPHARPNAGTSATKPHTPAGSNGRKPGQASLAHAAGGPKHSTGSTHAANGAQRQGATQPQTRPNSGTSATKPHTATGSNGRKSGLAPPANAPGGPKRSTGSTQTGKDDHRVKPNTRTSSGTKSTSGQTDIQRDEARIAHDMERLMRDERAPGRT